MQISITPHLPRIVDLIRNNATVSVVAPTGSGKSIGIPAALGAINARCFVVVPTRTAAASLIEYQRVLMEKSATPVNVGSDNQMEQNQIIYATAGHTKRKLLTYFSEGKVTPIDFCDVLMIDEIHSGNIDTTVIVSLWMVAAKAGVTVPRLVLASATPIPITIIPTPVVYTIDTTKFEITYKYLDKNPVNLNVETAALVSNIHKTQPPGHILVFASGSSEVEEITDLIKNELRPGAQRMEEPNVVMAGRPGAIIIPAFGSLKKSDIDLIYKPVKLNERKIIVATNIAEMSITIEDIGYVVDTMKEKRAETSQSGGFRLTQTDISKDSAKQRAGRTGRTRPGVCYRMCTLEKYESLEEHRPSEIQRMPIYGTVLELLSVGLSPESVLLEVDPNKISNAVQLLTRLGMYKSTVTDMGKFAPYYPLSVRNSAFLWKWIQAGHPIFPGIVVSAIIDSYGPSYYFIPRPRPNQSTTEYNKILQEYKQKNFSKIIGYNDLETGLNMWSNLTDTIGGIKTNYRVLSNYSRNNSMNNKKLKELLSIVRRMIETTTLLGYEVNIGKFTTPGVVTAARPLLLSIYSDVTLIQSQGTRYFSPITKENYTLDNRETVNTMINNPPLGIIPLVSGEFNSQRGTFRLVKFGLDTDKDGIGRPIFQKGSRGRRESTPSVSRSEIDTALDILSGLSLDNVGVQKIKELDVIPINPNLIATVKPIVVPDIDINGDIEQLLSSIVIPNNTVNIVSIKDATDEQLVELSRIGSIQEIYSKIGRGEPWNIEYVFKLREKNYEQLQSWLIVDHDIVVGFVGIHPTHYSEFPGVQLRIFVDPAYHGRGYATQGTKLMIKQLYDNGYRHQLWAFVAPDNIGSIKTVQKLGFNFVKQAPLYGNKMFNVYSYF